MDHLVQELRDLLEQTEPYQRKMKAKHSRLKKRVIGHGGQPAGPPYNKKPSMERSKSAPPIGENLTEVKYKKGSKFCLKSKSSGRNLGCYDSEKQRDKREKQIQYFKHMKENLIEQIVKEVIKELLE
jgi:hypothetical protein